MIIVEHTEDRCSLNRPNVSADVAVSAGNSVEGADIARMSA
jgi:hypothetical protein